jgi:hypothetical protein
MLGNQATKWMIAAAVVGAIGARQSSSDLLLVAAALAGVSMALRLPALRDRFFRRPATLPPSDMDELERRLRITEDELASATRDLAALKEQHEFDRELLLSRRPR